MRLPLHMEYNDGSEEGRRIPDVPLVRCRVPSCRWEHQPTWDDLGYTDWNALHPEHSDLATRRTSSA
jgi:hypothetical protein